MPSVAFHTFGCKVNQYDTQAIIELFSCAGYRIVPFTDQADIYVINTCTVTSVSDQKCRQMIRRVKRAYPGAELIITGCLSQNDTMFADEDVRLVMGTQNRSQIVNLFEKAMAVNKNINAVSALENDVYEPLRIGSDRHHTRAMLKIQDGCDNRCTYCIIPNVRGTPRSRPFMDIVKEAELLAEACFWEVVIIGIHLSDYGSDLVEKTDLSDVILALNTINGFKRLRLGSLDPAFITKRFIERIQQADKLCPQFHLSLQSGSDSVLKRMGRRYTTAEYLTAVDLIRRAFPNAAITTDIITGFPGETDQEFQDTIDMLTKISFSRVHVFPYSKREGTPASAFPDQIPQTIRDRRAKEIIDLGKKLAYHYHNRFLGTIQPVLFESSHEGTASGYTCEFVRVTAKNAQPNMILPVKITDISHHGMEGTVTVSAVNDINA